MGPASSRFAWTTLLLTSFLVAIPSGATELAPYHIEPAISAHFGKTRSDSVAGLDEVHARLNEADLRVVDVRPYEEYCSGRIRRSLSLPMTELEERLSELPKEGEIIVCGRSSYCELAREAVQLLKRNRYKVRRMEGGLPDWKLKGLPVTRSVRAG